MRLLINLYEREKDMYSIALYSNILTEKLYHIYTKLYFCGLISEPIIYTNSCRIITNASIPIFYTKYIFEKHYDIILSDIESKTDSINNMCDKLLIIQDNSTVDDVVNTIQEITKC